MIKIAIESLLSALPLHIIMIAVLTAVYLLMEISLYALVVGYSIGAFGSALVIGWILSRDD